jgi:protein-tyrosine phosphatase
VIDTHCHLLPGIDDGPANEADAIELARRLVEQGVRRVVCTPHVSRHRRPPEELVRSRLEHLVQSLRVLGVELDLDTAGEVSGGFAQEGEAQALLPWRIGERHVLVEVARDAGPSFFDHVATALERAELTPVFAHPERSSLVRRDVRMLDSLRATGAVVQVVAPSLGSSSGSDVYRAAWELLERGSADLVASDAHRATGAIRLGGVLDLIERRFGRAAVLELTVDGPSRLLGGVGSAG